MLKLKHDFIEKQNKSNIKQHLESLDQDIKPLWRAYKNKDEGRVDVKCDNIKSGSIKEGSALWMWPFP